LKFLVFLLLLFSLSFSYIGMNCSEMGKLCKENACTDAGGQYPSLICVHGQNFSAAYYENATGECDIMESRCEETGGMMLPGGTGCCAPAFALLLVLGCSVSTRFK